MLQSLASLLLDSIQVADAQMLHRKTLWGGHLGFLLLDWEALFVICVQHYSYVDDFFFVHLPE